MRLCDGCEERVATSTSAESLRRWRRRAWWMIPVALVAVAVGYYLVSLVQVISTGRSSTAGPADAIVVMGAAQYDGRPSPQLAARLDEVVRLWPDGYADVVVVTGGSKPGDRFTEAEASQRYLIERGVPEAAIVLENEGTNTQQSLESVAEILARDGRSSVIIVTDPFHSLRSRLIAEELDLEVMVAPTQTTVVTGWSDLRASVREAGGVALGRIIGFDRLSEITD